MATWTVRMFAYLKDRHGECVAVECDSTTEALISALSAEGVDTGPCRLAVNHEFVRGCKPLEIGDELALIPPVSGG